MDVSALNVNELQEKLKELNKVLATAPETMDFGAVAAIFECLRALGAPQGQYMVPRSYREMMDRASQEILAASKVYTAIPSLICWGAPEGNVRALRGVRAGLLQEDETYFQRRVRRETKRL